MSYRGNGERDPQTEPEAPFPEPETSLAAYIDAEEITLRDVNVHWLVEDLIAKNDICQAFGGYKEGKTLAVGDIACHVSAGMDWAGRRVERCLVIWVAGESLLSLKRRILAWRMHHDVDPKDMAFKLRQIPVFMNAPSEAEMLAKEVEALHKQYADLPVLIIIDTLAANFEGNENSQEDMQAWANNLINYVVKPLEVTCIVVHHTGHVEKGRGRGSSVLPGAVNSNISISKESAKPAIVKVCPKEARDNESGDEMCFRVDVYELPIVENTGKPVNAPILHFMGEAPRNQVHLQGKNQRQAMDVLRELYAERMQNLADGGYDEASARVSIPEWTRACVDAGFIDHKKFWDLKTRLVDLRAIHVEGDYVSPIG